MRNRNEMVSTLWTWAPMVGIWLMNRIQPRQQRRRRLVNTLLWTVSVAAAGAVGTATRRQWMPYVAPWIAKTINWRRRRMNEMATAFDENKM